MKSYLLIILLSAVTSAANAQFAATDSVETETAQTPKRKPGLAKRVINMLNDMYFNTKYDTNYVARPKEKWLLRLLDHFSPRYNIGTSFIMSNSVYNNDNLEINQNKWLTRVFLGMRF
jgi:hypothetical protein